MATKTPEPLKTDTERIVWLGGKIRTSLLAIEEANKTKAKAKGDIILYEKAIKLIRERKETEMQ